MYSITQLGQHFKQIGLRFLSELVEVFLHGKEVNLGERKKVGLEEGFYSWQDCLLNETVVPAK